MTSLTFQDRARPVLRVIGLTLGVLVIFGLTVLLIASQLALFGGSFVNEHRIVLVSINCALIVWLFVIVFHIRKEKVFLPFQDKVTFFENVKTHLGDLGYELKQQGDNSLRFVPPFHSKLFGGDIVVEADATLARVLGPKVYLERLQKRLRNQSFLEPLQKSLALTRKVSP